MPGYIGNYSPTVQAKESNVRYNTLACKLVTSFPANSLLKEPIPTIQATIMLFDVSTGFPKAILGATEITTWRTVAASLVATKHLWFERHTNAIDPRLAIIGVGVQGRMHAIGMVHTYKFASVSVWNRTRSKADELARELRELGVQVIVADKIEQCVENADIIVTATYSPVSLVRADMLKKGVHINGNSIIIVRF